MLYLIWLAKKRVLGGQTIALSNQLVFGYAYLIGVRTNDKLRILGN